MGEGLSFGRFTVSSLKDFIDNDRDLMLLCPVWPLKYYLNRTKQLHPDHQFICAERQNIFLVSTVISVA